MTRYNYGHKSNRLKKTVLGGLALAMLAGGIDHMRKTVDSDSRCETSIEQIISGEEYSNDSLNNSLSNSHGHSLESSINRNVGRLTDNLFNKRSIANSFSELSKYDDYISSASEETDIDKNLLYAIFAAESKGKLRAHSSKGAKGPAQLMTETAREMGLRIDDIIDERYNPEKAFIAGAKYLKKYDQFGKDYIMLMSYNLGPGRTSKLVRKYGQEWENLKDHIPGETRNYVIKVLSRKQVLDKDFSFDKKPLFSERLKETEEQTVEKGDSLYGISRRSGKSVEHIKKLNPYIRNYDKIKPGMKLNV